MDFRLPELGEGVYEAELVAWLVKPGDVVKRGQNLVEVLTDKATMATARLDEIARRLATLDDRTSELEDVDKRIQSLKDAARQAEQTTEKAIGPEGELRKHREAVQQLSSQALSQQTETVMVTGLRRASAIMSPDFREKSLVENLVIGRSIDCCNLQQCCKFCKSCDNFQ